jgi:hypothetical protein
MPMPTNQIQARSAEALSDRRLKSARRKFLSYFPDGFQDESYVESERDYKWQAHLQWREALGEPTFAALLRGRRYDEIANRALRIEGRTNLIFSFEKMALRDGVKGKGAATFAKGLYACLHGDGSPETRFDAWITTLDALPRKQTRVVTWPTATVFGFLADPARHLFIKPNVMRRAAVAIGAPFEYVSRPNPKTYADALQLAKDLRRALADMNPKDMIDIQSFLWVQGSDEYPA